MKNLCDICLDTFRPDGCGTGYCDTPAGQRICYSCADAQQVEMLKDRRHPVGAYLSGDGTRITSWSGGKLMSVVQSWPIRSRFDRRAVRAVDSHGGLWFGRGNPGESITLRPSKRGVK